MNFREIKGDLFNDTEAKIWIQGVNLKSTMGAGIAKEFKRRYPKMFEIYKQRCDNGQLALGDHVIYKHPPIEDSKGVIIYNIATQPKPGPCASLEAIEKGLEKIFSVGDQLEKKYWPVKVAMPRIGCGLGGLDWDKQVKPLVLRLLDKHPCIDLTVYYL